MKQKISVLNGHLACILLKFCPVKTITILAPGLFKAVAGLPIPPPPPQHPTPPSPVTPPPNSCAGTDSVEE